MKGRLDLFEEGPRYTAKTLQSIILAAILKGACDLLPDNCAWREGNNQNFRAVLDTGSKLTPSGDANVTVPSSQNRGCMQVRQAVGFQLRSTHSRPSTSLSPFCGYFPALECVIRIDILSSWWSP